MGAQKKITELLAPAGNWDSLVAAVEAGADAAGRFCPADRCHLPAGDRQIFG